MRKSVKMTGAALALGLAGTAALAQQLPGQPDPAKGAELTKALCSNCHIDDPNAPRLQGSADIPSFVEIARRQGQSAERIAGKIIFPNHPMPSITLTRDQMTDIASYILSLK